MKYNLSNVVCIKSNKSIYKEDNYLIKVFEDNTDVSKILNESLNQQRVLENTELNIPNLIEVTKIANKWSIVMEYIDGITLEQYLEEHKDQVDDILEILVATQIKIHSNNVPLLIRTKDLYRYKINKNTALNPEKKEELLKQLEKYKPNNKLCHGDLSLSNIVVKEDGSIWILDWAHASQGCPELDVARTYLTMLLDDKELAVKYLNKFKEKTNIDISIIKECVPIIAGSQLQKNKEENREKDFIDNIDYE